MDMAVHSDDQVLGAGSIVEDSSALSEALVDSQAATRELDSQIPAKAFLVCPRVRLSITQQPNE